MTNEAQINPELTEILVSAESNDTLPNNEATQNVLPLHKIVINKAGRTVGVLFISI